MSKKLFLITIIILCIFLIVITIGYYQTNEEYKICIENQSKLLFEKNLIQNITFQNIILIAYDYNRNESINLPFLVNIADIYGEFGNDFEVCIKSINPNLERCNTFTLESKGVE